MSHKVWTHVIRYWLRLEKGTCNEIVNRAWECAREQMHPWAQNVRHLLYRNGFGYARKTPHALHEKQFARGFLCRLNDQFVQKWRTKMNASPRFETLMTVKEYEYEKSPYLKLVHDPKDRTVFTRLRLDMNVLESCQGRFRKKDKDDRKCKTCATTETVAHFLTECPDYAQDRANLVHKLNNIGVSYEKFSTEQKVKMLLSLNTKKDGVIYPIVKFICAIYTKRYNKGDGHCQAEGAPPR